MLDNIVAKSAALAEKDHAREQFNNAQPDINGAVVRQSRLPAVGDKLTSREEYIDTDGEDQERHWPAGTVWEVKIIRSGIFDLQCEGGGWMLANEEDTARFFL